MWTVFTGALRGTGYNGFGIYQGLATDRWSDHHFIGRYYGASKTYGKLAKNSGNEQLVQSIFGFEMILNVEFLFIPVFKEPLLVFKNIPSCSRIQLSAPVSVDARIWEDKSRPKWGKTVEAMTVVVVYVVASYARQEGEKKNDRPADPGSAYTRRREVSSQVPVSIPNGSKQTQTPLLE